MDFIFVGLSICAFGYDNLVLTKFKETNFLFFYASAATTVGD